MTELWTFSFSSLRNEVQGEKYISQYTSKDNNTVIEFVHKNSFFLI